MGLSTSDDLNDTAVAKPGRRIDHIVIRDHDGYDLGAVTLPLIRPRQPGAPSWKCDLCGTGEEGNRYDGAAALVGQLVDHLTEDHDLT